MSNYENDGLDSFDLSQLGMKVGAFGGARILKFVSGDFVTREGEVVGSEREFISLGLVKAVQKFVGHRLIDTIIVAPEDKFPDLEDMNNKAPREEWGTDFNGNLQGPWTRILVMKLLDARTMDRFAFVTSSVGGSIAIGDLSDKTKLMRRLRSPNASPIVACHSALMKSRFNPHGIRRPDFRVVRWIDLGGGDGGGLPKPEPMKPLPAPEAATIGKPVTLGTPITPPTLKEEVEDNMPF